MRVSFFGIGLLLAALGLTTVDSDLERAEFGHGLTATDSSAGWISLFDGATTFGWEGARVENGHLRGGLTTAAFDAYELRAEVERGGSIRIGGRDFHLRTGRFARRVNGSATAIALGEGLSLRKLQLRPMRLKALFNGKDLADWKRIDQPMLAADRRPKFEVAEGTLRIVGGPGALEYQGGQLGELVLQVEVRTRARYANSGLFFRSIPGAFIQGYEAQVYNRCEGGDPSKPARWCTGAIDDRQNARRLVSPDHEWFTMTVVAHGPKLATWVNGMQQTDWSDPRPPHENPRLGARVAAGTIQLQAHDPMTDVEVRSVRARELR